MLVYFMKGKLPWEVTKGKEDAESKMLKIKQEIALQTLCKDLPKEFYQYLYYSRAIKFEDKPEYGHLKQLFASLLDKKDPGRSLDYDWNSLVADVRNLVCTNLIFNDNESNYKTVSEEEKKTVRRRRRSSAETAIPKTKSLAKNEIIDKVRTAIRERRSTPPKHLDSSCNLQPKDILEDIALLGTSGQQVDDTIPDERIVPAKIELPLCSYIKNAKHFLRNKAKRGKNIWHNRTVVPVRVTRRRVVALETLKSWVPEQSLIDSGAICMSNNNA
eukprot:TRINITY_DN5603_c0_g1_i3.p1 TRINITY_DN5603_c0_g1~~TRINITY_DN5603_c0_g1_i3.p1  ORF type:complete len:273 (+),score=39.85 TRINITY_DN5603_c0_g1_i3:876-1694(+)